MMSAPLWSGLGIVAPLEARVSGRLPAALTGISIDTRSLQPGDLFFAIQGDVHDGHAFVKAAFEKGAGAAVVDEGHAAGLAGSPCCWSCTMFCRPWNGSDGRRAIAQRPASSPSPVRSARPAPRTPCASS